jgi:hypothetical protein
MLVMALVPPIIAAFFISPGVPGATLNKIKVGMTYSEVQSIAGEPYNTYPGHDGKIREYLIKEFGWTAWLNPQCVEFDSDGLVVDTWVH